MNYPTPEQLAVKYAAITDLKERRNVFLDDITSFYTRKSRAVSGAQCLYTRTTTSPGCAIGRCLPIKGRPRQGAVKDPVVRAVLPVWMLDMDEDGEFLSRIQQLHDNPTYWDDRGLTERGANEVDCIKRWYKLT